MGFSIDSIKDFRATPCFIFCLFEGECYGVSRSVGFRFQVTNVFGEPPQRANMARRKGGTSGRILILERAGVLADATEENVLDILGLRRFVAR